MSRWRKGQSGNPAGRAPGSKNRASQILAEHGEQLAQAAIGLALGGDVAALRLCLSRIVAPVRHRPIDTPLAPVEPGQERAALLEAVNAALAGEIAPADAERLADLLDRLVETEGQALASAGPVVVIYRPGDDLDEIEGVGAMYKLPDNGR
jgi:hypothetical protein